jgi:hypothetical protein
MRSFSAGKSVGKNCRAFRKKLKLSRRKLLRAAFLHTRKFRVYVLKLGWSRKRYSETSTGVCVDRFEPRG